MNPSNLFRALFLGCFLFGPQAFAFAFVLPLSSQGKQNTCSVLVRTAHVKTNADEQQLDCPNSRRALLFGTAVALMTVAAPQTASARYVMDEETGEYVKVEDVDWQTEWKGRLDKASTMSRDEIFQAGRGAGNNDLRVGPESDASKKRRALSACRDAGVRAKAGAGNEKECTARVFGGEVNFLVDAL
jgi:hypothetical protein